MSKPKLSTKTPDSTETNALIDMHGQIIALPRERRYAIVELAVKAVNRDIATGEEQATLHAVHIEVPTGKDAKELEALLDRTFTNRTNIKVRPDAVAEADTPLDGIGELDDSVEA